MAAVIHPTGFASVGRGAFDGTAFLASLPDGTVYFGDALYCYKGVMPENTTVRIKSGTKQICAGAFKDCEGLVRVNIPSTVSQIAADAFDGCAPFSIYAQFQGKPPGWAIDLTDPGIKAVWLYRTFDETKH